MSEGIKDIERILREAPAAMDKNAKHIAAAIVTHFKSNFRVQGFQDGGVQPWKKRALVGRGNRATLKKTARLQRSIRKKRVSRELITVGTDASVKYAKIHNEGGKIPITPKMRRFFWAMYKKEMGDGKKETKKAKYFKALALTKKTHLTVPKRPFIGPSKDINHIVDTITVKNIKKLFNE